MFQSSDVESLHNYIDYTIAVCSSLHCNCNKSLPRGLEVIKETSQYLAYNS
jgi:hypothetical protein